MLNVADVLSESLYPFLLKNEERAMEVWLEASRRIAAGQDSLVRYMVGIHWRHSAWDVYGMTEAEQDAEHDALDEHDESEWYGFTAAERGLLWAYSAAMQFINEERLCAPLF